MQGTMLRCFGFNTAGAQLVNNTRMAVNALKIKTAHLKKRPIMDVITLQL